MQALLEHAYRSVLDLQWLFPGRIPYSSTLSRNGGSGNTCGGSVPRNRKFTSQQNTSRSRDGHSTTRQISQTESAQNSSSMRKTCGFDFLPYKTTRIAESLEKQENLAQTATQLEFALSEV